MKISTLSHHSAIPCLLLLIIQVTSFVSSSPAEEKRLTIGYIGCLTNFAANYGTAVLRGAELAVSEATSEGREIQLIVEDDQSQTGKTVSAYQSLRGGRHIDGLITGTWWANGIVKLVERDGLPFLSSETLYERDTTLAPNYFILQGDVGSWMDAFGPLIEKHNFKRGAMIRFNSGFALRLEERMRALFASPKRTFLGSLEYASLQSLDAATLVTRLRQLNPEVVYIDAEPGTLVVLAKKIRELGLLIPILTSSVAQDAFNQKLLDSRTIGELYFVKRATVGTAFVDRYRRKFNEDPVLNADLGYYSTKLLIKALQQPAPVTALKSGIELDGIEFKFDSRNLLINNTQQVWSCNPWPCHLEK